MGFRKFSTKEGVTEQSYFCKKQQQQQQQRRLIITDAGKDAWSQKPGKEQISTITTNRLLLNSSMV